MTDPILRIAARGDGVSASGRHVPLSAPGDWLDADGRLVPGPRHQAPPCRHFPSCGGCQLQQLDDLAYARFVRDRVVGALAGQGIEADVLPAMLSPPATRRRATLHGERRGGHVSLGFVEGASHRIVDLVECHVLLPELFALVAPLRALLARAVEGRDRVEVHLTRCDQGVDLLLVGRFDDSLRATEDLSAFAERHRLARLSIDGGMGPETRWEPDRVTITLGGVPVPMPPAAFLQATAEGEAALLDAVRELVAGAATVADLFAGLGTFALGLGTAPRVYAAEAARDAILSLKGAAARAGRQLFADHRDLFRRPLTAEEASRFGAVILDPPRAGAREQVAQLAASSCPVIAYVSCNPSSFARDVKTLIEGGYRLGPVRPVGQFRWSTHVELVAGLTRDQAG